MPLFSSARPANRESQSTTFRRLQIFVLFTGMDSTAAALRTAHAFVCGLGGEILIAANQVVPYPLPLSHPPVDRDTLLAQIGGSILQSSVDFAAVPKLMIAYTRDSRDGWRAILPSHCIVIIGQPKYSPIEFFRSWRTAKALSKLGHEVLWS